MLPPPRLDARRAAAAAVSAAVLWALLSPLLAQAEFRSVSIVDNAFQPDTITVRLGDTVVWQHNGDRPHGVRSNDGLFDSSPGCSFSNPGPCMKRGDTFSVTFQRAGTFFYHCPVHGSSGGASAMSGHVTVDSGPGGTTAPTRATTTTRPATTTTTRPTTTAAPGVTRTTIPTTATTATTTTSTTSVATVGETTTTSAARTTSLVPTTTTLVALPAEGSRANDRSTLVIIGLVILAAALASAAWYFRPGRPPVA